MSQTAYQDALTRLRNKPPPDIPPIEDWAAKLVGKTLKENDELKADSASSTLSDPQPRVASKQRYPFMIKRKWARQVAARDQTSSSKNEGTLTTTDMEEAPSGSAVHSRINFMNLPPEIRLQILREVLTPSEATFKQHGRWTSGSIIFACKKLYEEGQPIGLEENTFKRADLPKRYIVQGLGGVFGHMVKKDRLNLHVDETGVVSRVSYG